MTVDTKERMERMLDKAVDWDSFIAGLPKLHMVENLYGKDQDGLVMPLDPKYKVALHEFEDRVETVPIIRSESYREMSHDYVMNKIHDVLEDAALSHRVLSHGYAGSTGELYTDIVLDKAYKMDEKAFEDQFGVSYTDTDDSFKGEYRPLIKIRNSFCRSSQVQLGILRVVCSNGMIALSEKSRKMTFTHIGDVIEKFDMKVTELINDMFSSNLIENMMLTLEAEPIEYRAIISWLMSYLGRMATLKTIDMFGIGDKELTEETDKWIAYNIITWAASNAIQSAKKRERAMASIPRFIDEY